MFPPFGESETFVELNHPIPCDSISIEEKILPSPIKFPTKSLTADHPKGVDEDLEDYVYRAPTHVQHASTHDYAITSPEEPLNCLKAGPYGQGSASINDLGQSVPTDSF